MVNLKKLITTCQNCSLCKSMPYGNLPVPGRGQGKVMLVQEAINEEDAITENPLSGMSGAYLDKLMKSANIDLYITSLVKCRPCTNNKTRPPNKDDISSCKPLLLKEIEEIKPTYILAAGQTVFKELCKNFNIPKQKGVLSEYIGKKFVGTQVVVPIYSIPYLVQRGKRETGIVVKILKELNV